MVGLWGVFYLAYTHRFCHIIDVVWTDFCNILAIRYGHVLNVSFTVLIGMSRHFGSGIYRIWLNISRLVRFFIYFSFLVIL